jgi:hypothetical protein
MLELPMRKPRGKEPKRQPVTGAFGAAQRAGKRGLSARRWDGDAPKRLAARLGRVYPPVTDASHPTAIAELVDRLEQTLRTAGDVPPPR